MAKPAVKRHCAVSEEIAIPRPVALTITRKTRAFKAWSSCVKTDVSFVVSVVSAIGEAGDFNREIEELSS